MRAASALLCVLFLAACGTSDEASEAGEETMAEGPTMAEIAGTWQTENMLTGVDTAIVSTMRGSAAGDDWTLDVQQRMGVPLQVSIQGDSVIIESAEFESVLRPGVMVTTRTATVMQDANTMAGNMVAIYRTPTGEERVQGTVRSHRMQ